MTPEELKEYERSSSAFNTLARPFLERILKDLGLNTTIKEQTHVSHHVEAEPCTVHGATIEAELCRYAKMSGGMSDNINVEVTLELPDDAIMANTYLDHVAAAEGIKKNHRGHYCAGPKYASYDAELHGYNVEAYSPWNNHYLCIQARGYTLAQMEQATTDVLTLARPMVAHLANLKSLRYWNADDAEVVAKAKEIIAGADLHETDVDREEKAHWVEDHNSFFRGWFYPLNDRERGTFDTLWPSSVDYAASNMGHKGTFEYAVACVLLENGEFIAKARQACRIRKEKIKRRY